MPNRHRGEISTLLDGRPRTLVLTLGALAELEDALETPDLIALVERFESGRPSARDALETLAAGLRAAGGTETRAEIAAMRFAGGPLEAVRLAARLLEATFADPDGVAP